MRLSLNKMRDQVNKAYNDVLNCQDYKKKRDLLKKFYQMNAEYNRHKQWVNTMATN